MTNNERDAHQKKIQSSRQCECDKNDVFFDYACVSFLVEDKISVKMMTSVHEMFDAVVQDIASAMPEAAATVFRQGFIWYPEAFCHVTLSEVSMSRVDAISLDYGRMQQLVGSIETALSTKAAPVLTVQRCLICSDGSLVVEYTQEERDRESSVHWQIDDMGSVMDLSFLKCVPDAHPRVRPPRLIQVVLGRMGRIPLTLSVKNRMQAKMKLKSWADLLSRSKGLDGGELIWRGNILQPCIVSVIRKKHRSIPEYSLEGEILLEKQLTDKTDDQTNDKNVFMTRSTSSHAVCTLENFSEPCVVS